MGGAGPEARLPESPQDSMPTKPSFCFTVSPVFVTSPPYSSKMPPEILPHPILFQASLTHCLNHCCPLPTGSSKPLLPLLPVITSTLLLCSFLNLLVYGPRCPEGWASVPACGGWRGLFHSTWCSVILHWQP